MGLKHSSCNGGRQNRKALPVIADEPAGAGKIRASRMARRRALVLGAVHLLIIGHVLHWWVSGRTVSPVEPSEAMRTLERGELNAGFIFFALALLSTLILGRWFCGWGCHVVALQDLCGCLMKKCGVRPRPFRSRLLIFVPLAAGVYMFVWPSVYRLFAGAPESKFPGFTAHLSTTEFWKTFPGVAVAVPFLAICGFAVVYFLGSKGYCTYACPYGGFFGLLDRHSPAGIRVTDACDSCGHCTATCTSNVRVHAEVRDFGRVVDPGCMKCLDCVSVCPQNALYFGFGRPASLTGARVEKSEPKRYDLTWGEELLAAGVFLVTFVTVRGIYGLVPFLLALGLAGIAAYAAMKLKHLIQRREVRIQNLRLKSAGRIRGAGAAFIVACIGGAALLGHSAFYQYHHYRGTQFYAEAAVPEEVVLSGQAEVRALPPEILRSAERARDHLGFCARWGLHDTIALHMRLAWCSLILLEPDSALDHLRRAEAAGSTSSRLDYYRGSIHLTQGRPAEAAGALRHALEADPGDVEARFKLGVALAQVGDLHAAESQWRMVLETNPGFAAARHNLAGALRQRGKLAEAVAEYQAALEYAPDDADTHLQLALTLQAAGRNDDAARHFKKAQQLAASVGGGENASPKR